MTSSTGETKSAETNPVLGLQYANRRQLLRANHFNCVLRTLCTVGLFSHIEKLFVLMSNQSPEDVKASLMTKEKGDYSTSRGWHPSTFTIAEFIRAARISRRPRLASSVMHWGVQEQVHLPEGVIRSNLSDIILFPFSLLILSSKSFSNVIIWVVEMRFHPSTIPVF
jgi:hypothetical protein